MEYSFTAENFEQEVLNSDIPVLIDFYADWCGPCRSMLPIVESLAQKYEGRVKVGKVNSDEQQELAKAWEREVNAYVQSVMGPKLAKWHEQAKTALDQQKSESVRKQSEVQQRDTAAMQQEMQMTAAERLQQRAQIKEMMAQKAEEIQALDTHIRNDIAGKAAKIAILHHFTMVLANPAEDLAFKLPMDLPASMKPERFMPVVGSDTEDVTDELVSEVSTLESKDDADGSSEDS